ncbi:unnamed protein product [Protopolystoma xenopodis]|uniref:Uncharacterized protein n=1 Tax=Protopolystoma xenopodis TaxID=117903 RepID=A0A448WJR1_9PLAT|nr:unnamed protein product [Protopolystoma xenopodis]
MRLNPTEVTTFIKFQCQLFIGLVTSPSRLMPCCPKGQAATAVPGDGGGNIKGCAVRCHALLPHLLVLGIGVLDIIIPARI